MKQSKVVINSHWDILFLMCKKNSISLVKQYSSLMIYLLQTGKMERSILYYYKTLEWSYLTTEDF